MLFDVWIKLTVEDCDIRTEDIRIDSEGRERLFSERISDISADYDCVRMDGTNDRRNECIFFILHSLIPQIPQPFTIKITSIS